MASGIEKILSGMGKSVADLMKERVTQSRVVRDLRKKWVEDNYHNKTVQLFKAAVTDAQSATKLPDDLVQDLLTDKINRQEVYRWVLEGVQPGHLDAGRLNLDAYIEQYPKYQDQIYSFFQDILCKLKEYKKIHWAPEFLILIAQFEEFKSTSTEGFKLLDKKQDLMLTKQSQMYDLLRDELKDSKKSRYDSHWFEGKVKENIKNIGERYSEDLHVEQQISGLINAIEKNSKFRKYVLDKCSKLLQTQASYSAADSVLSENLGKLREIMAGISSDNSLDRCLSELIQIITVLKKHLDKSVFDYAVASLRNVVNDFYDYVNNALFRVSLNPFVMIAGGAGVGKSHFITDLVMKRLRENKVSIFLLGQLFHSDDTLISQIRKQLDIASEEEMVDLFEIFNNYGVEQNERMVIFIDALNEGKGKHVWLHSISGFIERLRKYSHIALVMSVRDTYERDIIPEHFYEKNGVVKVKLEGFDDTEKALEQFFTYYKVPLHLNDYLKYQFKNPLFLKVYCLAYEKNISGVESIEAIFNNYFKRINANLKLRIDKYPKYGNLVVEALGHFIDSKLKYIDNEHGFLYETAARDVNYAMSGHRLDVNFFDELVNEKIITVNTINRRGEEIDIVYLAFELFDEFITAKKIIEINELHTFTNKNQLNVFFSDKNPYQHLLSDKLSNQGVFEALAVQIPDAVLPENTADFEIYNWPKSILKYKEIDFRQAYYNSLIWRRPDRISGESHSFILNDSLVMSYVNPNEMYNFWDVVLKFSIVKNHYYNANYLYKFLMRFELDEFNSFWTVYVSNNFEENDSFKTIMKWVWKRRIDDSRLDDESILLLGMNITWFTASTTDRVRDVSIKALVKLFENKIEILLTIIKKFRLVDDLYILEALFCAAYGCVIKTSCKEQVTRLAEYIYSTYFDGKEVIPHAMLRSYMVGIIEFAEFNGLCTNIDAECMKPPYKYNHYDYYEVKQHEIDSLRKVSSYEDLDELNPYQDYLGRGDFEFFYTCQNNIISNLESCYTGVAIQQGEFIDFQVSNMISQIVPPYRDNFVRMVIKEIFDMGYNYIKFGEFDFNVDYNESKSLGQKYEWIAFNKILTIYLDSYPYIYQKFTDEVVGFEGVWQFTFLRGIDPSIDYFNPFDTREKRTSNGTLTSDALLNNFSFFVEKKFNSMDWIAVNSINYTMESHYCRTAPFILKLNELEEFKQYLGEGPNMSDISIEDLYVREIYWSEAYRSLLREKYKKNEFDRLEEKRITHTYIWDINDGAMLNYIEFSFLSPLMMKELNASIGSNVFELMDINGDLVSVSMYEHNYENMLLINKEKLVRYLLNSQKVIVWPISGDEDHIKVIVFDGIKFTTA